MRTISYTGFTFQFLDTSNAVSMHWYDTDGMWNVCLLIPDQVVNNTLTSVFMLRLLAVESNVLLIEH